MKIRLCCIIILLLFTHLLSLLCMVSSVVAYSFLSTTSREACPSERRKLFVVPRRYTKPMPPFPQDELHTSSTEPTHHFTSMLPPTVQVATNTELLRICSSIKSHPRAVSCLVYYPSLGIFCQYLDKSTSPPLSTRQTSLCADLQLLSHLDFDCLPYLLRQRSLGSLVMVDRNADLFVAQLSVVLGS
jgi:hypothetical protein|mmetsp:Transcript_13107/g.28706  ORF Transcript_13107/g.28706 Transcript_13107/m.28706 type:complete len:187 (-) Transcript_13107:229-789(-)